MSTQQNNPWRMIQTNLAEIDMLDIDADRYVEELKKFAANICMINTAGIIASYQTELKYHLQSPFLKGDSLLKIVEKCHSAGIRVIARTDFSKVRKEIYELHPEWAYRTREGKIVSYEANVHLCPNSAYQQEYMMQIIEELFRKIPFDGIYFNFAGFYANDYDHVDHGMCYCENCRRRFRERFAMELPKSKDENDPAARNHKLFIRECTRQQEQKIRSLVKSINPDLLVPGVDYVRLESNTEMGRPLPHWQHSAASNTRVIRGTGSAGIIPSNTTVDFIGYKTRFVSVGESLTELRLWQNLANLGSLDYYLMRRLDNKDDRTPYAAVKKVFGFHKENEAIFKDLTSKADVLVMREKHWSESPEERGWIRALTECHLLFDEITVDDALRQEFTKYKVIILPDQKFLPEGLPQKLDDFAGNGGIVLCTGITGFVNHKYERVEKPTLNCLGVEKLNYIKKDTHTAFLKLKEVDKKVFTESANSEAVAIKGDYLLVACKEDVERFLEYVLESPAGPPELVYYTKATGEISGVLSYKYGAGAGVMIPWSAGALYYQEGYPNSLSFMKDVLLELCGLRSIAEELTPMVEVTVAENSEHTLLQLVNNSGHYGVSYHKPLAIYDIVIRIPFEKADVRVTTLRLPGNCCCEYEEGLLKITVKELNEYEAVIIKS